MNDETVINTHRNRFILDSTFREIQLGIKRRILNLSKSTTGNDAFEFPPVEPVRTITRRNIGPSLSTGSIPVQIMQEARRETMRLLTPVQDTEGQSSSVLLLDSLDPIKGAHELPQSKSSGSDDPGNGPVEVEPLKQGTPASGVTITASRTTRRPISHASDSTRPPTGHSGSCVRTSSSPKTHFTFNIPK